MPWPRQETPRLLAATPLPPPGSRRVRLQRTGRRKGVQTVRALLAGRDVTLLPSVCSYFAHLEGCGAPLHKEVRDTYYQFVLLLVEAVKGFRSINDRYCTALACLHMRSVFADFGSACPG